LQSLKNTNPNHHRKNSSQSVIKNYEGV
jgi:hypothetical protein